MFPALDKQIGLRLVETRTFGSGVIYLRYHAQAKSDALANVAINTPGLVSRDS